jgi:hypothetical protein
MTCRPFRPRRTPAISLTMPTLAMPAVLAPAVLALVVLALAGCEKPLPPSRASVAALSACRTRADEIYLKQNRAVLSERDQSYSPQSASGLSGITTTGLADLYGRDQMVSDCLNSMGPASPQGPGIDGSTGPAMDPNAATPNVPHPP